MARTSAAGIEQLVAEEGEVLHAYRDIAGNWTIGVGLTAASGIVKPAAGMAIDQVESRRLLALALSRNYEPAVMGAMPQAPPPAFDGAVSFHFNTGAISRASWVDAWHRGDRDATQRGLMAWNKAGGRVLGALQRRRAREAELILDGHYATRTTETTLRDGDEGPAVAALQADLIRLGLMAPPADGRFGAGTEAAVRRLQTSHADLVEDGVAGPATLAQIRRVLDARNRAAIATASAATAAAAVPAGLPWALIGLLAGAAVLSLFLLLVRNRDEVRALINIKRI